MADNGKVKVRVKDQLHLSSVQADTMGKGFEFTTDAATAKILVDRGLVTRVSAPKKKAASGGRKAAPASGNKMAAAPQNQSAPAPTRAAATTPARKRGIISRAAGAVTGGRSKA